MNYKDSGVDIEECVESSTHFTGNNIYQVKYYNGY